MVALAYYRGVVAVGITGGVGQFESGAVSVPDFLGCCGRESVALVWSKVC